MVEAWRERRENPIELGLGLLDLSTGRETTRAQSAAFTLADALTRICAYYPSPKQARDLARKNKGSGRRH
jgi:hypothetical protein